MKILVIDDEPLVRRSLEKVFSRDNYEVVLAEDGLSGVEAWRRENPDAVIIDVLMPGLTGPEVIAEVKPSKNVAIALISAYSGDYNPDSVKQLGADIFIGKPFEDIQAIVDEIKKLLESKKH